MTNWNEYFFKQIGGAEAQKVDLFFFGVETITSLSVDGFDKAENRQVEIKTIPWDESKGGIPAIPGLKFHRWIQINGGIPCFIKDDQYESE